MKKSNVVEDLVGCRVKINIKVKERYTRDLYKSIQGAQGIVLQRQGSLRSCAYDDAWLVEFDNKTTRKYAKTPGGQWQGTAQSEKMAWWTERRDMEVIS